VSFFSPQDFVEQVATDIVIVDFAIGDSGLQVRDGVVFNFQIALDNFHNVLADAQGADVVQVWQSVEEQNALDDHVGVFHFIDRFFLFFRSQSLEFPVVKYA